MCWSGPKFDEQSFNPEGHLIRPGISVIFLLTYHAESKRGSHNRAGARKPTLAVRQQSTSKMSREGRSSSRMQLSRAGQGGLGPGVWLAVAPFTSRGVHSSQSPYAYVPVSEMY